MGSRDCWKTRQQCSELMTRYSIFEQKRSIMCLGFFLEKLAPHLYTLTFTCAIC